MITYKQLTLAEIFEDCQIKPELFTEQYLN